jgi:hypothetical protein
MEIKMKRSFRMYVVEGVGDYVEMVGLCFEIDGVIVDECIEDCIDNILIESYEMYKRNCEKYMFDSRFDSMEIDLRYRMGM